VGATVGTVVTGVPAAAVVGVVGKVVAVVVGSVATNVDVVIDCVGAQPRSSQSLLSGWLNCLNARQARR
jgi:hypothetical protein